MALGVHVGLTALKQWKAQFWLPFWLRLMKLSAWEQ